MSESGTNAIALGNPATDAVKSTGKRRIGLALSGGGFRAMLFHLGVIRALHDCKLLQDVELICSVSGGSILAAHLVLNWPRYISTDQDFKEAAGEVIEFVQTDIWNRVSRRWLAGKISVLLRHRYEFVPVLEQYYDKLYRNATFGHLRALQNRPKIHILSTSLTTGNLCRFTNEKFEIIDQGCPICSVELDEPRISLAVAASSAYSVLIPAVPIDYSVLGSNEDEFQTPHVLTDGGVFDNLGLEELTQVVAKDDEKFDLLIVSDASGNFDYKTGKKYAPVLSLARSIRANDIMMHRMDKLGRSLHENSGVPLRRIEIGGDLTPEDAAAGVTLEIQRGVRNIKTHLNASPDLEVDALVTHGQLRTRRAFPMESSGLEEPWHPVGNLISTCGRGRFEELRNAERWRRMKKLAYHDKASWSIVALLSMWIVLLVGVPLLVVALYFSGTGYERGQTDAINEFAKVIYVLPVTDSGSKPTPGIKVAVEVFDSAGSKYEGLTDEKGQFKFIWQGPPDTNAAVHIDMPDFDPVNETRVLSSDGKEKAVILYKRGQ